MAVVALEIRQDFILNAGWILHHSVVANQPIELNTIRE